MKYFNLVKYDIKGILRDKLLMFLIIEPIIFIFLFHFVFPGLITKTSKNAAEVDFATNMIILLLSGICTVYNGALLAFNLIESKDDNSIKTISVTPLTLKGYIKYKSTFIYVLTFIGIFSITSSLLLNDFYQMGSTTLLDIFFYALVLSLSAPVIGLLISSFAKSKVEGFALLKGCSFVLIIPLLVVLVDFFKDYKQYVFFFVPNFWAVQALRIKLPYNQVESYDMSSWMYLLCGFIVSFIVLNISIRIFDKKQV